MGNQGIGAGWLRGGCVRANQAHHLQNRLTDSPVWLDSAQRSPAALRLTTVMPQTWVEDQTSNYEAQQLMFWLYAEAAGGYEPSSVRS